MVHKHGQGISYNNYHMHCRGGLQGAGCAIWWCLRHAGRLRLLQRRFGHDQGLPAAVHALALLCMGNNAS